MRWSTCVWVVVLGVAAVGLAGCGRESAGPAASASGESAGADAARWARDGERLTAEFESALKAEDYQRAYEVLAPVRSAMPAELRGRHRFAERQLMRAGEERAAQAAAERAAEAQRMAAAQAVEQARVERIGPAPVMSAWDGGYYEVQRYLKRLLHDPDSLAFEGCTRPVEREDGWGVVCEYRARNGFGALRKEVGTFVIREGEVVAKLD
jgi:hypothetical protein